MKVPMKRKQNVHSSDINVVSRMVSVFMTICAVFVATSLGSCVKKIRYNTSHPDFAKISLSPDWTARGEGVPVPEKWAISIGDYTVNEYIGQSHEAQRLFEPGSYSLLVYNPADGITVEGTTATVSASSEAGQDAFISGSPAWFFTAVQDVTIEKDREYLFSIVMKQQIRRLTLIVEPTGKTADLIEGIEGSLSGVAGKIDFATGSHSSPSKVKLDFTKISEGADAGKWMTSVLLLGIADDKQQLSVNMRFIKGSALRPITINSDLSAPLAGFNTDKPHPLVIGGTMVETPTMVGVVTSIDNWEVVDLGNIEAKQ